MRCWALINVYVEFIEMVVRGTEQELFRTIVGAVKVYQTVK